VVESTWICGEDWGLSLKLCVIFIMFYFDKFWIMMSDNKILDL